MEPFQIQKYLVLFVSKSLDEFHAVGAGQSIIHQFYNLPAGPIDHWAVKLSCDELRLLDHLVILYQEDKGTSLVIRRV